MRRHNTLLALHDSRLNQVAGASESSCNVKFPLHETPGCAHELSQAVNEIRTARRTGPHLRHLVCVWSHGGCDAQQHLHVLSHFLWDLTQNSWTQATQLREREKRARVQSNIQKCHSCLLPLKIRPFPVPSFFSAFRLNKGEYILKPGQAEEELDRN